MKYPHRIRLRGPWECEPSSGVGARVPAEARRVSMPCDWSELGVTKEASVVVRRRFGYPGRIDSDERVWLIINELTTEAELTMNGHTLGSALQGSVELDVTPLLRERNVLAISFHRRKETGRPWSEVALEIRHIGV